MGNVVVIGTNVPITQMPMTGHEPIFGHIAAAHRDTVSYMTSIACHAHSRRSHTIEASA